MEKGRGGARVEERERRKEERERERQNSGPKRNNTLIRVIYTYQLSNLKMIQSGKFA